MKKKYIVSLILLLLVISMITTTAITLSYSMTKKTFEKVDVEVLYNPVHLNFAQMIEENQGAYYSDKRKVNNSVYFI